MQVRLIGEVTRESVAALFHRFAGVFVRENIAHVFDAVATL